MNDLEERLRAALRQRAQTYEISPGAWAEVQRRTDRGRGRVWLLATLAVVLVAALAPFVVSRMQPEREYAVDPAIEELTGDRRPLGAPVTLTDPAGGGPITLWFARAPKGHEELCYRITRAPKQDVGGCYFDPISELETMAGWYAGTTFTDGAARFLDYGVARDGVVKVHAQTGNGRIEGTVQRTAGAPLSIWSVPLSAGDEVSKIFFVGADDRQLGSMSRTTLKSTPSPGKPAGAGLDLPGGLLVQPFTFERERQVGGDALVFIRRGKWLSTVYLDPSSRAAQGFTSPVRDLYSAEGLIFGVADAGTARVDVHRVDGSTLSAQTVPDPWGLGLTVFSTPGEAPWSGYSGHDASGAELWRQDLAGVGDGRRAGEAVTVPGAQSHAGEPLRLWLSKLGQGPALVCATGDQCTDLEPTTSDFAHATVTTYLPVPGEVIRFGGAPAGWTSLSGIAADGRRFPGAFMEIPGASRRIWVLRSPRDVPLAAIAVAEPGHTRETVHHLRRPCLDDPEPVGTGVDLGGGITAHLHPGACLRWWSSGRDERGFVTPPPAGKLSDTLAAERPIRWTQAKGVWLGVVTAETTRVETKLEDGRKVSARTIADPWGQGVRLFSAAVPTDRNHGEVMWRRSVFVGYEADGQELWRHAPDETFGDD